MLFWHGKELRSSRKKVMKYFQLLTSALPDILWATKGREENLKYLACEMWLKLKWKGLVKIRANRMHRMCPGLFSGDWNSVKHNWKELLEKSRAILYVCFLTIFRLCHCRALAVSNSSLWKLAHRRGDFNKASWGFRLLDGIVMNGNQTFGFQ
jgi:hypothetical protein